MTLTLYYSPGACSLASHIALEESGLPFRAERLNFGATQQRSPEYLALNPKGRVPVLVDGDLVVTESPAILRNVASRAPAAKLWPDDPAGDARCAEWLAWLCSGVHVAYAHVRRVERYATGEDAQANVAAKGRQTTREAWEMVERKLAGGRGAWAAGDGYSVADPYLYVFWRWGGGDVLAYDMPGDFPAWTEHARRLEARPATRRVLDRETLPVAA